MQRVVEQLDMFAQVEIFVLLIGLLKDPFIIVSVKNTGIGLDVSSFESRRKKFHLVPQLCNLFVDAAVFARIVGQNSPMEFFGSEPRLTPTEEDDGRCAA